MCECIAQFHSPDSYLHYLAYGDVTQRAMGGTDGCERQVGNRTCPDLRDHDHIIHPNHRLAALMNKDGSLCCQHVRWGWSPVWSMGVRPPLTHLPLQIVMRSKVFKRMRDSGRAVVAVDGWFDFLQSRRRDDRGRTLHLHPTQRRGTDLPGGTGAGQRVTQRLQRLGTGDAWRWWRIGSVEVADARPGQRDALAGPFAGLEAGALSSAGRA